MSVASPTLPRRPLRWTFADAAAMTKRNLYRYIRVPTLLINARDDPFEPREVLAMAEERASEFVRCAFTDRGGHVGWVVGPPWAARSWGEDLALEWLARAGNLVHPTRQL